MKSNKNHVVQKRFSEEEKLIMRDESIKNLTALEIIEKIQKECGTFLSEKEVGDYLYRNKIPYKKRRAGGVSFRYTEEHLEFLKEAAKDNDYRTITRLFNKKFNLSKTDNNIRQYMNKYGIYAFGDKKDKRYSFTTEQYKFLDEIYENHSVQETVKLFNEKFGTSYTCQYLIDKQIVPKKNMKPRRFSEEEKQFILENFDKNTMKMADFWRIFNTHFHSDRSYNSLRGYIRRLF